MDVVAHCSRTGRRAARRTFLTNEQTVNTRARPEITTGAVWNATTVGAPVTWTHMLKDETRDAIVDTALCLDDFGITLDCTSSGCRRPSATC